MLVVLPLLLLILGGIIDLSRSLTDRAELVEISRTVGRAASRTWVVDEPRIARNATMAATRYLEASGYDTRLFRTRVLVRDLPLGGSRYSKGVEVQVTALAAYRPYHFLPARLMPAMSGTSFYRLENARVEIRESESDGY